MIQDFMSRGQREEWDAELSHIVMDGSEGAKWAYRYGLACVTADHFLAMLKDEPLPQAER